MDCPICAAESDGSPICRDCRDELADTGRTCPRCAMSVGPWTRLDGGCDECRGVALGFDAAIALGPYNGPIRDLCLRIKHRRDAWLAPWLAELVVEARRDALNREIGSDSRAIVVPVPLHWRRRLGRGYNQAEAIADALADRLGLRMSLALRRIKGAAILAGAGRAERRERLRGAFRSRSRLDGRTVLLVDDILTTGATCGAAARALKKAGAKRVVAVVIGRAEGKG
jgi:ComF family protein